MANQGDGPEASKTSAEGTPRTTVVGIGASAGGIRALKRFFGLLPAKIGAAFVVIVHLDPDYRSELPEILAGSTKLTVKQATGASKLKPDCVYVIPPDKELRISDHEIAAVPFEEPRGQRAPIDHFFRSLAEQHGGGFAIVFSGAGSDGALGVKAIKQAGGIILVQDPHEAEHPSMPRSAIATGAADFILPVEDLAARIVELVRQKREFTPPADGSEDEQLRRVLAHLRVRTGHDFAHYKRSTVMRRVTRRMQVARKETLDEYFPYLRENAEEAGYLLADLLISVTTFFRDAHVYEAVAKLALPNLFHDRGLDEPVRVWVAGCATGEEAYSMTMLLMEEASRHDLRPDIQVFASDMDAKALAYAREGHYPATIEASVSDNRLRRFFSRDGEGYRVKRELRDMVLFANHSLLKDPPFSRVDLISCRNVLIYLARELQAHVLASLHYGLSEKGYLLLGTSETAEHPDNLFRVVDREARLYQSTGWSNRHLPILPRTASSARSADAAASVPIKHDKARGLFDEHRDALESTAPPSVLVDDQSRIVHLSETAGRYLEPSGGMMTTAVTDLVRQELRFDLRSALHRAFERNERILTGPIRVGFNGSARRIHLQVSPVVSAQAGRPQSALVTFIEAAEDYPAAGGALPADQPANEVVNRLTQELDYSQAQLRVTREEAEAASEELRAANEELQSINEEYRSTAEELETSKEELQSINEELQTVNSELKLKLESVSRANSDLQNLMAATDFATLFLDTDLKIKRFTPKLAELFSITQNDVGRPITDFTHRLDYETLPADARRILQDVAEIEREIESRDGKWFQVRFRPYRTLDDKIDGVVTTFMDVTERRHMEDTLRRSEELLRRESRLVELSRAPIFQWDFDGGILQWNRGSEELYGYTKEEALGAIKDVLLQTSVPGSTLADVKAALMQTGAWKGELHQVSKDGSKLIVESQIELVTAGPQRYVLESTRDITNSKAWDARQRLLLRELTHRVRNTLTVVQSMVHQTWRGSGGKGDFIERVDGRIAALANSHKLLVDTEWQGADLRNLVESQMAAHIAEEPGRLRVEGNPVTLPPDLAMPFGMVLHELVTNAVKYGALSSDKGTVDLTWKIEPNSGGARLNVRWQESGGPAVEENPKAGFGAKLIQAGIPGATVVQDFLPGGVRYRIEIPLPRQKIP